MTINEMYSIAFSDIPTGTELSRKEIIAILQKRFEIDETSILPSDLCYNSSNKSVEDSDITKYFIKVRRGQYIYVGSKYDPQNINPYEYGTINANSSLNSIGKIGSFYSWSVITPNAASKETDKSFYEHNESGIPIEIRWFFGVTKLNKGDKLDLILEYEGRKFAAYIKKEKLGRTRLKWSSDLGRIFNEYYKTQDNYPLLMFERKGTAHYSIEFSNGTKNLIIDPLDETFSYEEQEKFAKTMDLESLRVAAISRSKKEIIENEVVVKQYYRDPYISEYTKKRARGVCQLCGQNAPFIDSDGQPYLESHHITWISRGGEDSINNTVALCPNCHRKMHIVDDSKDVQYLMKIVEKNK